MQDNHTNMLLVVGSGNSNEAPSSGSAGNGVDRVNPIPVDLSAYGRKLMGARV